MKINEMTGEEVFADFKFFYGAWRDIPQSKELKDGYLEVEKEILSRLKRGQEAIELVEKIKANEYLDSEREGFYEKMWKDFVSLQRGDIKKIAIDAERYRWLRDRNSDVALVLDKVTGEIPACEGMGGGGYKTYEYRAEEELDAAIDAAMLKTHNDNMI